MDLFKIIRKENQIGVRLLKNKFSVKKQALTTRYSRKEKLSFKKILIYGYKDVKHPKI